MADETNFPHVEVMEQEKIEKSKLPKDLQDKLKMFDLTKTKFSKSGTISDKDMATLEKTSAKIGGELLDWLEEEAEEAEKKAKASASAGASASANTGASADDEATAKAKADAEALAKSQADADAKAKADADAKKKAEESEGLIAGLF